MQRYRRPRNSTPCLSRQLVDALRFGLARCRHRLTRTYRPWRRPEKAFERPAKRRLGSIAELFGSFRNAHHVSVQPCSCQPHPPLQ